MRIVHPLALLSVLIPAGLSAQMSQTAKEPAPATNITWPTLPLKHAAKPTRPDITAEDLMTRLYIYADDSLQGREAGQLGDFKATTYIAAEAKRMGLIPAGDSGTYFQTVPYKNRALDSTSTITVGGATLKAPADFILTNGDATQLTAPVIFGGDLNDSARVDLDSNAVKGKIVLFTANGGINVRRARRTPRVKGAVAAIIAGLDDFPPQFLGFFNRPRGSLDYHAPGAPAALPNVFVTHAAAAKFFTTPVAQLTVGATGSDATLNLKYVWSPMPYPSRNVVGIVRGRDPKLAAEYVAIGGHNDHIGMNNRPVDHDSMRIFLRVVRPEGAEQGGKPATPDQQAEVDSILAAYRKGHPGTERLDSISNGADDDGSGTVSVLEIAERISSLKVKPRRSIIFVWHVGEEKGLLGSQYFTDFPTVPRDSIVAQLNIDMVGRGDATDETGRACKMAEGANPPHCDATANFQETSTPLHGNPNYLQIIGSRRLSTELGDLIEKVNTQDKHGLAFDYSEDANGHPTNIYCRSDHYEYARYGIPIAFFTTGGHADYHQVTDEPQEIDYEHMARIDNLIEDIAVHVADLDHRIVVDHPKPDPFGGCQQ
ncbi:MAG TPA: M28 family peptidase [Gemmatimonadales bacterium]|nr:M28 family peptidase [Gemmatimonadales bacterium]